MTTWPTQATELYDWLNMSATNRPSTTEVADVVIEAAVEHVAKRTGLAVDATEVPARARLAALLYAAKWHGRPSSPDGVAKSPGDVALRIGRYDADAEAMIEALAASAVAIAGPAGAEESS